MTTTMGATDKSRALWIGGSMKMGGGRLQAQVTRTRQDVFGRGEGEALTSGLAYIHSLSRRTSLYAAIGTVHNDANTRLALNTGTSRVGGTVVGADPCAVQLGMRYDF